MNLYKEDENYSWHCRMKFSKEVLYVKIVYSHVEMKTFQDLVWIHQIYLCLNTKQTASVPKLGG